MNFAKKQLEKYGWKEGKGLGKNENGIIAPLKPKLKFDNAGMGHNAGDEFTDNWWNNVYKQSLDNIQVKVVEEKTEISVKSEPAKISRKKHRKNYDNFVKTSVLMEDGEIIEKKVKKSPEPAEKISIPTLTDEELFEACSGRTAHKGARHGMKLSGKLKRLQEQEAAFLKSKK